MEDFERQYDRRYEGYSEAPDGPCAISPTSAAGPSSSVTSRRCVGFVGLLGGQLTVHRSRPRSSGR
jgi:hypothetical protein